MVIVNRILFGQRISQFDQGGNRRIQTKIGNIAGHLGDGLVHKRFDLAINAVGAFHLGGNFPDVGQEPHHADNRIGLPRLGTVKRAHIHLVRSERIDGVLVADFLGRDAVFITFAHLARHGRQLFVRLGIERDFLAIDIAHFDIMNVDINTARISIGISRDHALVKQFLERLGRCDIAKIKQNLVPEPRIQQVKYCVFRPADIKVNRPRKCFTILVGAVRPIGRRIV